MLKTVFSLPRPKGLAFQVPRHLVHTPPTRTHPHYTPWVTSTSHRHSEAHVTETLIVGVSYEIHSHSCIHTGDTYTLAVKHYCNWPWRAFRQVAGDWCSCEGDGQGDQFAASASSALSSAQRDQKDSFHQRSISVTSGSYRLLVLSASTANTNESYKLVNVDVNKYRI